MTKTEHIRLKNWRLKVLRYADDRPRNVSRTCRHFGISRHTPYKWRGRPLRPGTGAAPLTAGHAPRGRQQDPAPATALSFLEIPSVPDVDAHKA